MSILTKLKSFPLYIHIIIGMLLGIGVGIIALSVGGEAVVSDWIAPWGDLFVRLLQLIALPLVFFSLIMGVLGLKDIRRFSRLGGKTIAIYMMTTVFSVVLGLSLGLVVKPGKFFDRENAAAMGDRFEAKIEQASQTVNTLKHSGPLSFLYDIVPNNIVSSLGDNGRMLQVIFFAIVFGLAMLYVTPEKVKPLTDVIGGVNMVLLKMVDFFVALAPLGVFSLMARLVIDFSGDLSMFSALSVYALTVMVGLLIMPTIFYPTLIFLFSNQGVKHFVKSLYPVQLFAFTTSSSAATLPYTLEMVERDLKVSNETASFVLPVGTTINMDGTSLYQSVAVLFIAQVLGIDLSLTQLLTIVVMTVLSSIGTPAVPGGSYVVLTMVLTSIGIPAAGLALILGIDRPLDMLRTAVNVTGDAAVCVLIDKKKRSPHE